MDTQNDAHIAARSVSAELSHCHVVVGVKQLKKALSSGIARKVYLAEDADPAITEPIVALCQHNHVDYAWVCSMNELGRTCGIEVGAAAAAAV